MNVYLPWNITDMQWPCASWFHIPTTTEITNLKIVMTSLSVSDYTTYLKMPLSWWLGNNNWQPNLRDSQWYYRTSEYKKSLFIKQGHPTNWNVITCGTRIWLPIRPFKDTVVVPDSNWAALYQWAWDAWIYHNPTLWLISISSDWTNWITISDKNLWATTVYNSWDTLAESNCGKFYQRGNNYWFPFTWATSTPSAQVDASSYWPWNYYSSSNFRIASNDSDWFTPVNYNLRWWVTWVSPAELKNDYIGKVYEYSYDFRGKSIATCQSDGWSFSDTSTVTINSDWMNCGINPASVYCIPSWLNTSLSTATKITMEMMFYKGSKSWNAWTNAVFYISWPSSMSSNWTGWTSGYDENSNYVIGWRVLWTVAYSWNYNSTPNGTYILTTVIDLANKTINTKYWSIANLGWSLTDAQISTIRTLKYLRIYSDTTAVIKTINVTIV